MEEQNIHNILLRVAKDSTYTNLEVEHLNYLNERTLIQYFLDRETKRNLEKVEISEEDLKRVYEQNKRIYRVTGKVKLETIFMSDIKKATEILEEINSKNFEEYKKKFDEKTVQDTDEYIQLNNLQPQILALVGKYTKKGVIKKLAYSDGGVHIILLKDKEEEREATFDEVKEIVKEQVKDSLYTDCYNKIIEAIVNMPQNLVQKEENEESFKIQEVK